MRSDVNEVDWVPALIDSGLPLTVVLKYWVDRIHDTLPTGCDNAVRHGFVRVVEILGGQLDRVIEQR